MARKLTAQVSGGTVARYVQNVQTQAGGKAVADGLSSFHPVILVRFSPPNYQTKCEERTRCSKWRRSDSSQALEIAIFFWGNG